MALTAQVKDELSRLQVLKSGERRAEVSALLRFAGGLHIVAGRVVVEAALDTGNTARRLRRELAWYAERFSPVTDADVHAFLDTGAWTADQLARPGVVPAFFDGSAGGARVAAPICEELGLTGWVANGSDGSVHCRAEGSRADLDALVATLETGPASAHVERVIAAWGPGTGSLGPFGIRSGGHTGD